MPSHPPPDAEALSLALGGSVQTTTAVAEVTRRLLDYFTSDTVPPGTRLPAERALAQSMGVGRSAIREALAALEVLGVVDVRPGSGTYLRGGTSELLPQTLSWGLLLGEPKTRELIEVRHGLEVQVARLAAAAISADQLAELTAQLELMRSSGTDFEAFVAADMIFHRVLTAGAANALLEQMLQSVRSLLRVWVERALDDADHAELTCTEHAAILAALRTRDADAAATAMSTHMDSAAARLLAVVEAA